MKRLALTAILVVTGCVPIVAPAAQARAAAGSRARIVSRLDHVVSTIERLNVPGGVIGVTGKRVGSYQRAFGVAAPGRPMTLGSEFRVASITKTFTATVILELVDRGKLELNQAISRWEPRLPYARIITIRKLLNMTSSIFDEGGPGSLLSQWIGQNCALANPMPACSQHYWSPQSIVNLAIRQGAQFPPGVYSYSDTNYVLLAMIAQDVTHKPFWLLLKQMIFDRLHLRHTFFPTSSTTMPPPATAGYDLYERIHKKTPVWQYTPGPQPNPSILFGAGAIISNLGDLRVWAKALATGTLLKSQTQQLRLQLLQTGGAFEPLAAAGSDAGLPLSYGLGVASLGGMLGHNGVQAPLYTAEMWYSPPQHGSVVVLFNTYTPCVLVSDPAAGPVGELADSAAVSLAQIAYGASLMRVASSPLSCQAAQPLGNG
jgi:D-alanyl-D-alanine carboxypeptidase